jgi:hypothetical protein
MVTFEGDMFRPDVKGVLCGVVLVLLSACASIHEPPPLAAEEGMHVAEAKEGSAVRVAGALRWSAVKVSEVDWQADAEVDAEQRAKLCALLRDALQRDLQTAPSDGGRVIQVRARIVGVVSASPALNVASSILLFIPIDRGGASVQIDAADQATGQRLASLTMAGSGQLGDFSGHFSRYGHAEDVLLRSAAAFRKLLENENEPDRNYP